MRYSKGLRFISNDDGTCYVVGIEKCRSKNIVIPPTSPDGDSVTRIGSYAFGNCTNLTNITIPNSMTEIGYGAFFGCKNLTSVTIGNSVAVIRGRAFDGCTILTRVTFAEDIVLKSIGNSAFSSCISLTNVTIPNSVTSIGDWAFYHCTSLESIIIPDSVTSIGVHVFGECSSLKSKKGYYKAFRPTDNPNILFATQNNTEYEIGKKKSCLGELECCSNGLHLCTNIFDIFNHYYGEYGKDFVIAICDASDEHAEHKEDSKIACRWVVPKRVLSMQEVIDIMNGD